MLRSVRDLLGYPVKASDGKIGKVEDCLFADTDWRMRHLVMDTGRHIGINLHYMSDEDDEAARRRSVLIEPEDLREPSFGWVRREFRVGLTKDKIEHSPSLDEDAPVSAQYEREFTKYYRHIPYEDRPNVLENLSSQSYQPPVSAYRHDAAEIEEHKNRIREISRSHLQSAKELMDYQVEAEDGSVGQVQDFIVHQGDWIIRQMVVRLAGWAPRKSVLIRMNAVSEISWSDMTIRLDMLADEVEAAPLFRPHAAVNRDGSNRYFDYTGRPSNFKLHHSSASHGE